MESPKKFPLTPTYIVLDVIGVILMGIGFSSFAYTHEWIPQVLRFEGYGIVFIVAGIAAWSVPGYVFLYRDKHRKPEQR